MRRKNDLPIQISRKRRGKVARWREIDRRMSWFLLTLCVWRLRYMETCISCLPNFRFVLITSRARAELERLRNEKPEHNWEKPWHKLLNHSAVNVVTFGDLLEALQDHAKTGEPSPSLFATAFARDYFTILECEEDVVEYWEYWCRVMAVVDDNGQEIFLRDWIADSATEIALRTGYITSRPTLPSDEKLPFDEKNNWLKFSGSPHEVQLIRRHSGAKATDFWVSVDNVKIHFDLQAIQPLEITEKLGKLKRILRDRS